MVTDRLVASPGSSKISKLQKLSDFQKNNSQRYVLQAPSENYLALLYFGSPTF